MVEQSAGGGEDKQREFIIARQSSKTPETLITKQPGTVRLLKEEQKNFSQVRSTSTADLAYQAGT